MYLTHMSRIRHEMISRSAAMTEAIGEAVGRKLRGGEVIELASDLGGGKTTLTRGMAHGAGSDDHVASPTFTVSKVYQTDRHERMELHHFDFYRLDEAGVMRDELAELIGDPGYVVIVEWSDIVKDVLPEDRLTISLQAVSEDERAVTFEYPEALSYLIESLVEAD